MNYIPLQALKGLRKGSEVTTKREDGHKSGHSGASERVNGGAGVWPFVGLNSSMWSVGEEQHLDST